MIIEFAKHDNLKIAMFLLESEQYLEMPIEVIEEYFIL